MPLKIILKTLNAKQREKTIWTLMIRHCSFLINRLKDQRSGHQISYQKTILFGFGPAILGMSNSTLFFVDLLEKKIHSCLQIFT